MRGSPIARCLVLLLLGGALSSQAATLPPGASSGSVLWSADHETGDTSQWYFPSTRAEGNFGGGEYDNGNASVAPSKEQAHSGLWSLKMSMSAPSPQGVNSGARMFRWAESQANNELYYSVWYYFPKTYSVANWWNVFQWKSRHGEKGSVDPFFIVNVGNRPNGEMYLYLYDWQQRQSYSQVSTNIPIGRWFQVRAFYRCSPDAGEVTIWQDGTLLAHLQGVRTRYSDGDCQWSVDNYSDSVKPAPAVIYIDDALISRP